MQTSSGNRLSIQAGLYGLSYLLEPSGEDPFFQFVPYRTSSPAGIERHLISVLEDLFGRHKYQTLRLVHHNPWQTWVPEEFFDPDRSADYLRPQIKMFDTDTVAYDRLPGSRVVNVYLPMVNLNNLVLDYVPEVDYYHSATLLQNYVDKSAFADGQWQIIIRSSTGDFQMGVWQGRELRFFNTFPKETTDDFLYYFLYTWEKWNLEKASPEIILTGPGASSLYDALGEFVPDIRTTDLEAELLKLI